MIRLVSYKTIGPLAFGEDESLAISTFGQPVSRRFNREKQLELHYTGFILRYDASLNQLKECTLLPDFLCIINEKVVSWNDDFLKWLCAEDNNLMEVFGYIVSFKLGIALTGFHDGDETQKAIHFFMEGDWDALKKRMQPFEC